MGKKVGSSLQEMHGTQHCNKISIILSTLRESLSACHRALLLVEYLL